MIEDYWTSHFQYSSPTACNDRHLHEVHCTILRGFGSPPGRVLWRIDGCLVTVRSIVEPCWPRLCGVHLLDVNRSHAGARGGDLFAFLLRANPTVKIDGRRHPAAPLRWLERKTVNHGFELIEPPALTMRHIRVQGDYWFFQADFAGHLRVADAERFNAAIIDGIGSAKGFGFGMLVVDGTFQTEIPQ